MEQLEKRGYINKGAFFLKELGDYSIKVFKSSNETLIRQILFKNSVKETRKITVIRELEVGELFEEALKSFNEMEERQKIEKEEELLSGLEKEKRQYIKLIMVDESPQIVLQPEEIKRGEY